MSRLLRYAVLALTAVLTPVAARATVVEFTTPLGNFQLELFNAVAPNTVANFLNYVTKGEYNGSVFHRAAGIEDPGSPGKLIPFVLQGGGYYPPPPGEELVGAVPVHDPVKNEFVGTKNLRGTIAMALPSSNQGTDIDGATNQWFFNLNDNSALLDPQKFTVFGQVLGNGMDVVDALSNLQTYDFSGGDPFNPFATLPMLPTYTPQEYLDGLPPDPADWVTFSVAQAVPEPASWAMAGGGAVLLGSVLARGRHKRRLRSRA
jgi:peptidyl-prolyl cis-trans isomerase A (cyclophilin A)